MRWWGWGEGDGAPSSCRHAAELLRSELGLEPGAHNGPVALEDVRLPEPSPADPDCASSSPLGWARSTCRRPP